MAIYHYDSSPASGILLVEGLDDKHVVWHLCGRNEVLFSVNRIDYNFSVTLKDHSTNFTILEKGNRIELLQSIRQVATTGKYQSIGVVLDADQDVVRCWNDIVVGFSRTGSSVLGAPSPTGTIILEQPGQPRVGIWVMPDNRSSGEVEDFVIQMVPDNDLVWPVAADYIERVPEVAQKFEQVKTDKAKLYAWLATRREPSRMGAAIGALDLEVNVPLCREFFTWLKDLFG